jgi:hypothetical protein
MHDTEHGHEVRARRGQPASALAWRRAQLVDSGFPALLAGTLARDGRYDLHRLIELVERGCPPGLAVRILAPLDESSPHA